ncbi:MAG: 3-deoxy-D-manno-octulosonic acid transferase [Burkholderiaceae bacterium]|jgi:3-deoxy-D-manno-octulosonic-acid transferase|nr:3-deoxy-D-manno-octulosonic acid transferase [Burkholderiaceae bacterium]
MSVARRLYDLAAWCAQPLFLRKLRRRGRAEPGYLEHIPERFGHYTQPRFEVDSESLSPGPSPASGRGEKKQTPFPLAGERVGRGQPLIWIHAVSLGETRTAAILLDALRARWPEMRLLLTHGTATGRAVGAVLLRTGDTQVWQPWDTPAATRRFFARFRPDAGVLMETEIWPNLIGEGCRAKVPIVLANARLSEKSLRGARRAAMLLRPAYAALSAAWAQTEADADRLRQAGARNVTVLGNLKFDAALDAVAMSRGQAWRAGRDKPVVMLASSREGEEALLLDAIRAQSCQSAIQWLIVPRHPQRFDAVADLIRAAGWSVSRRSAWPNDTPPAADGKAIWLGDSLGEMAAYYTLADAALLGGSFAPLGGQNLIEAAACGCPVVMGPHTFNFDDAARQSQAAGAALRAPDLPAAIAQAVALMQNPARQSRMAQAARAFAASQRGAAQRMTQALAELLRQR